MYDREVSIGRLSSTQPQPMNREQRRKRNQAANRAARETLRRQIQDADREAAKVAKLSAQGVILDEATGDAWREVGGELVPPMSGAVWVAPADGAE